MSKDNAQIDVRDQKERVRRYFEWNDGWRGGIYRNPNDRFARAIVRRRTYAMETIRTLGLPAGSVALDVGCGSGMYLEALAEEGFRVYGSDYSQEMVELCRERLKDRTDNITVLRGDVERLPFDDATADVVLCIGVLGYLLRDEGALTEISRVLKPGGYFLVNVENMMSLSNIDYVVRRRIQSLFSRCRTAVPYGTDRYSFPSPWVRKYSPTSHLYRLFHPKKFERLLREYSFSLVEAWTFGFEFRLMRKLGIVPGAVLEELEIGIERLTKRRRVPLISHAGEAYTGLFRREES